MRVITRVGHTEGPQRAVKWVRDASGLNADIAMKGREERGRGEEGGRSEGNIPCPHSGKSTTRLYRAEGREGEGGIYTTVLIEFPVAIILLYTGRFVARKGKKADAVSSAINIRAKSYVAPSAVGFAYTTDAETKE